MGGHWAPAAGLPADAGHPLPAARWGRRTRLLRGLLLRTSDGRQEPRTGRRPEPPLHFPLRTPDIASGPPDPADNRGGLRRHVRGHGSLWRPSAILPMASPPAW